MKYQEQPIPKSAQIYRLIHNHHHKQIFEYLPQI